MIDPRLKNKIRNYIRKTGMLHAGDRVLIGVSGGADSVFLCIFMLELREEYGLRLRASHVHHGIRGADADGDELFVRNFCEKNGIPLTVHHRNVPLESDQSGETLEEAGRSARYECFYADAEHWNNENARAVPPSGGAEMSDAEPDSETGIQRTDEENRDFNRKVQKRNTDAKEQQRKNVKVALAHHMDDQAETVLFRIARGTGIRGLKGMEGVREENGVTLIRPLLCVRREEIRNALTEMKIPWREDATNEDDDAARNRLRHDVLPLLETEVNSRAVEHLAELAKRAQEAQALIEREADKAEDSVTERLSGSRILLKNALPTLLAAVKRELILRTVAELAGQRKNLGSRHAAAILDLFELEDGSRADLPYGLAAIRVECGVVVLRDGADGRDFSDIQKETCGCADRQEPGTVILEKTDQAPDPIPEIKYTKWLDYDKIKNTAVVRTRRTGDFLTVDAEGHKKSLSDYFTDAKVPKEERDRIPLVADGQEIVWVVGYRIGYRYRVTSGTKRFLRADAVEK